MVFHIFTFKLFVLIALKYPTFNHCSFVKLQRGAKVGLHLWVHEIQFISVLLLIIVVFSLWTIVNLLLPNPVFWNQELWCLKFCSFFLKTALAVWGLLWFYMKFMIVFLFMSGDQYFCIPTIILELFFLFKYSWYTILFILVSGA